MFSRSFYPQNEKTEFKIILRKVLKIMAFEKVAQSVQFNFTNEEKYGDKGKNREYKNVKFDAGTKELLDLGAAICELTGDQVGKATLITKQAIKEN